jgi:hypothetical protein
MTAMSPSDKDAQRPPGWSLVGRSAARQRTSFAWASREGGTIEHCYARKRVLGQRIGSGHRWAVRRACERLHDDAIREYAYGPAEGLPDSKVGTFTQALYDEAKKDGWTVISMKNDWKRIFAFE